MIEYTSRMRALAVALAVGTLLGACVVAPVPPPYPGGGVVMVAPPPPVVESYGVPPGPGYIWISGYWNWSGSRHVWTRGHWERDRPGYRWAPTAGIATAPAGATSRAVGSVVAEAQRGHATACLPCPPPLPRRAGVRSNVERRDSRPATMMATE